MTDSEWESASEPHAMLESLQRSGGPSARKLRLFAVACSRRMWDWIDTPGRMAVEVVSADWVKRFFEAHDQFVTWMDGQMLPRRQDQHLREGRRQLDRTTRYDPGRRTMTAGDGPSLPLPTAARDALSAFLFARTLPLEEGYEARFPVVEGGRQLTATLRVTGADTAMVQGQRVGAWRAEARFESRSERRPVSATLLITRDARRVPVEILVDAGFGSFRVELTGYSSR